MSPAKGVSFGVVQVKKDTFDALDACEAWPLARDQRGAVFCLATIQSAVSAYAKERDRFFEVITRHLHELAKSEFDSEQAERIFEESIQALNEHLATWLSERPGSVDLAKSGLTIALLAGPKLILTGFGPIFSLFCHFKSGKLETYDLLGDLRREKSVPEKVFRTVIMGELEPGDIAILGNNALFRLMTKDELQGILISLPATSAAEQLKLLAYDSVGSVTALVLRTPLASASAMSSAKVSVEDLYRSENRTAEVLTRKTDVKPKYVQIIFRFLAQIILALALLVWQVIRSLGQLLTAAGLYLWKRITRKIPVEELRGNFNKSLKQSWSNLRAGNERFSKPVRYTAVALAIILVLTSLGLSRKAAQDAEAVRLAVRNAKITAIRTLLNEADARLIFDEAGAKTKLEQAEAALLASKNDWGPSEDLTGLEDLAMRLRATIRKEKILATTAVATLPEPGLRLASLSGVPAVAAASGAVYRDGKSLGSIGKTVALAIVDENAFLLIDENGVTTKFTDAGEPKTLDGVVPLPLPDAAVYSGRLYAPTTKTGDIIRLEATTSGWSTPRSWLKTNDPALKTARSIAIDSDIFVATPNSVLKYSRGARQAWELSPVEPALTDLTRVWTSGDASFLYLLEAKTNRLVVFVKNTGTLKQQYVFPDLSGASDFLVDEKNKKFYLLSGNSLNEAKFE